MTDTTEEHCLRGLGGPHQGHGVPAPMRCSHMLHWWQDGEHDDGKGAAMAAAQRHSLAATACSWHLSFSCLATWDHRGSHVLCGCVYSGSRGGILDFGEATKSDKGQWVWPIKNSYGLAGHWARSGQAHLP